MTRIGLILTVLCVSLSALSQDREFPLNPDPKLTPGVYCKNPDARRYPEKIAYCNRDVDVKEKLQVIRDYNQKLGYRINLKERTDYKIDHLIPLCAGGDNGTDNLWPQHMSVYKITDPIEALVCEKMAQGKLTQKRAIELVFKAKFNLSEAPVVIRLLQEIH